MTIVALPAIACGSEPAAGSAHANSATSAMAAIFDARDPRGPREVMPQRLPSCAIGPLLKSLSERDRDSAQCQRRIGRTGRSQFARLIVARPVTVATQFSFAQHIGPLCRKGTSMRRLLRQV